MQSEPDAVKENLADEEIISRVSREPALFEFLVDRYQPVFLRRAGSITRDTEAAADLVQDTFVKIYLNAARFRRIPGASFKSWAFKILINTCFSWCEKNKREKTYREFPADENFMENISDSGAARDFEQKLNRDVILSAISKMPVLLGRMLRLSAVEGRSHSDIAKMEGVGENVIRTRIHRAKKVLENLL
ncbi:MAG: RNA polymerase sigma factor [Candidatus Taylorbacteria bacterium]|nr:RNA polymerase sigma factor [Candidatus Taylorbacteria bacterium]